MSVSKYTKQMPRIFGVVCLMTALPACAQDYSGNGYSVPRNAKITRSDTSWASQNSGNVQQITPMRTSVPINRPYSYRVTVGSQQNSGWEKTLTDGDPNLKRWTWVPVTSYNQATIRVEPGKDKNGRSLITRPANGVYVKPTQISPNAYVPSRAVIAAPAIPIASSSRSSSSDVQGKVKLPRPRVVPTEVYSYGKAGQYQSTTDVGASIYAANKDVHGQLLNKSKNIR